MRHDRQELFSKHVLEILGDGFDVFSYLLWFLTIHDWTLSSDLMSLNYLDNVIHLLLCAYPNVNLSFKVFFVFLHKFIHFLHRLKNSNFVFASMKGTKLCNLNGLFSCLFNVFDASCSRYRFANL